MRKIILFAALLGLSICAATAQRQLLIEEMPLPAEEQLALASASQDYDSHSPAVFVPSSSVASGEAVLLAHRCSAIGEQVRLSVDSRPGNQLQVALKDRWGRVVLADRLVHPVNERVFDLAGLPREAYILELRGEQGQRIARYSVILF